MADFTERLGLMIPDYATEELSALPQNWDRLDEAFSGVTWVTDGTQPDDSSLFEGALVAEINSGIVWRAAKNSSGIMEKKYIKYPWQIYARSKVDQPFNTMGTGYQTQVYDNVLATHSKNAGPGDLVDGKVSCPVTGIYQGVAHINTFQNGSLNNGQRALTTWLTTTGVGGGGQSGVMEHVAVPYNGATQQQCKFIQRFNRGDQIQHAIWNSGTTTETVNYFLFFQLVRVL